MRTTELLQATRSARRKLAETKDFPIDEPHRESTIQRFEYTFELSWKLMQSILKDQGIDTYGIKNVIREAGRLGLIENVENWLEYLAARNQTSHIYLDSVAESVYKVAMGSFGSDVDKLIISAKQHQ